MSGGHDERRRIDAANTAVERAIGWVDRVLPFRRLRPLARIPSLKLKLSLVLGAAIAVTMLILSLGDWLGLHPLWGVVTAAVVAVVVVQILARGLTAPMREMMEAADEMAAGDYDQRVTVTGADEVGELARSFNAMAANLADLERQRRDLIANVSHELRTPLAALRGNVENLLDGVADDPTETLAAMGRQTERLGRLVGQLLDLSRLEAGASPMHMTEMDLVAVVEQAVEEARLRVPEPKVVVVAPRRVPMTGDPERLQQVVANLLDNAIRYNPPDESVQVTVGAAGGPATVTVADGGPGVPTEQLEHIFERFHRADSDRATRTGGFGLGLAISQWIVDLHGGTITAANTAPGLAVTVTLPT